MVAETLIDSHVSERTALVAVNALLAHTLKRRKELEEKDLLPPKEDFIWLVVATKKVPRSHKVKPIRIPLAHPLLDPRETSICLFTKDPQRQYKDLLAEKNITFVSRVVGITKLRGKHKPFEARRQLLKDHGIFLTDDRIVPLLPKLLGKMFFDAKKQPVPVRLSKPDLKAELAKAVSATYMHQNAGTVVSIKLASLTHTPDEALSNLRTALGPIVQQVEGGWDNVMSLSIKTGNSMSLPIWSCDIAERFSAPSLEAAEKEARAIAKAKREAAEEEKRAKGKKRKGVEEAAEEKEQEGKEEPSKKKTKTDSAEAFEEGDDEFQGFAAEDDDDEPPAKADVPSPTKKPTSAESAPSSNAKPRKSTKPPPSSADADADDLEPLPLITPSTKPTRKQKSSPKTVEPVTDDLVPAKPVVVDASKPSRKEKAAATSKKGASVTALQQKIKKTGKAGAKPSHKKKILGRGKLDD